MSVKLGVAVMTALLALYLVAVAQLSISLISASDIFAKSMGVALLVLPIIGAWAMVSELSFGIRSHKLSRILTEAGEVPLAELPRRASGRPVRSAADAEFPHYKKAAEDSPDDWRSWFRLGMAYDASGDRRRARQAIRHAIALERQVQ